MYGLGKTLTFIINVFWVGLSSVLKVDLFCLWFGRKIFDKKGEKIPHLCFYTPLLRQRSARLGKDFHLGEGRLT